MRLFKCQCCEQLLYFENTNCERCGHLLGYDPARFTLRAMAPDGDDWREAGATDAAAFRFCANAERIGCNWLVEPGSATPFCAACRHNHIIPDLDIAENLPPWRAMRTA
jgi:hypothetical protein